MSQLQVTGEAKIRDIQGPVVANSGVITALDGAASQYVRGDGTLADFPTSSGGGSSVSYYLNSSVSQGTIGGVAYRELSKEPIIGAGTDIAIAANGYVASYLTDANDPDVLSIPGGNFNCEFYFSVSNDTGNPFFYAELYKYDGTTFTLLGSSVGVPEYINQGTIIAPYYFAIPVPTSALAVTDRLAIRIYVNVDGRTVTLHTENSHLCQVVTTLSKGMVSLNNLTDQSQYLTTGTSGTDFNIVSSGDTHTFNIPSASASNRGLITTGSQTIAGIKTLSVPSQFEQGLYLKQNMNLFQAGYIGLGASTTGLIVGLSGGGFGTLNFNNTTSFTYTFPDVTGTIALLEGTQTFTGEKVFNNNALFNSVLSVNYGAWLQKGVPSATYSSAFTTLYSEVGAINAVFRDNTNQAKLQFQSASNYTYTFPAASGTVALTSNLSSYVPYTGATTNVDLGARNLSSYAVNVNGDGTSGGALNLKMYNSLTLAGVGYLSIYAQTDYYFGLAWNFISGTKQAIFNNVLIPINNTRYYNLPNADGTLALTSDLSAYLPLTGGTLTGALNGTTATFSGLGTFYQLTMTGATAGRLFYAQTGGVFSQSGNLVWNNTTEQLGVGTPNPSAVVTAFSTNAATQLKAAGTAPAITFSNTLTSASLACVFGLATANNHFITGTAPGDMAIANQSTSPGAIIFGTDTFEKMRMSSNGNFGIATSSPATKLDVSGTIRSISQTDPTSGVGMELFYRAADTSSYIQSYDRTNGAWRDVKIYGNTLYFGSQGTNNLTITSAGNVGIGTSSPQSLLQVGNFSNNSILTLAADASSVSSIYFGDGTGAALYRGFVEYAHETDTMRIGTSSTERMRITSGGNVLIGTTSTALLGIATIQYGTNSTSNPTLLVRNGGGNAAFISFSDSDGATTLFGWIVRSGSGVNYASASDYRLKQDFKDYNALELISAIKTYDYEWKSDKSRNYGVLAHELQEVIPYAVTGEKDGEQMQGVDYSKIVPILVKAIQELNQKAQEKQAQIELLSNKIVALESK
jgi:hypothetical protein